MSDRETIEIAESGVPSGVRRALSAVWDGIVLIAVLAITALAVVFVVLAAPIALAVSAIAGAIGSGKSAPAA